jgi:hypothetical protein
MSVAEFTPSGVAPMARPATESRIRIACALGAAGTLVPFALCSFSGTTGAEITQSLRDDAVSVQIGAATAVLIAPLLLLAALRLGRRIGGTAGAVATGAGVAVAVMFAAYYAAFGAGAVVADLAVSDPGPGVGEGTSLLVNFTELTRYAPGLALVAAAFAGRRSLPRAIGVTAALLAVLTVFPMTSWVAALLIPLWLGTCAAALGSARSAAQNSRSEGSSMPRSAS